MASKKSITLLSRSAPYGGHNPQLCLDMALAYAVFEQEVSYVFLDDGVYQLQKEQNADAIDRKTLGNALETLELYGISNVLVDKESMEKRSLSLEDLLLTPKLVSRKALSELLKSSDVVFNL